jgi:antitoxin FitA
MRQLIARIDDGLHRRLKLRAASEGRSVNAVVSDLLNAGLAGEPGSQIADRIRDAGIRVVPELEGRPPSRDAAIRSTAGWGRSVSEALAEERAAR